jgi:hypothetical protein
MSTGANGGVPGNSDPARLAFARGSVEVGRSVARLQEDQLDDSPANERFVRRKAKTIYRPGKRPRKSSGEGVEANETKIG